MIRMCCACRRIEREGEWLLAAVLVPPAQITHGYCPECFVVAMAEIKHAVDGYANGLHPASQAVALPIASSATFAGAWRPCA